MSVFQWLNEMALNELALNELALTELDWFWELAIKSVLFCLATMVLLWLINRDTSAARLDCRVANQHRTASLTQFRFYCSAINRQHPRGFFVAASLAVNVRTIQSQ